MTIKNIIGDTATYLGLDKILKYVNGDNTITLSSQENSLLDLLIRCANLVIGELSCTYVPMIKRETVTCENGKIRYSSLTEKILEVVNIYDLEGEEVFYKVEGEYVKTDLLSAIIEYKYLPSNYGLTDTVGFIEGQITSRIIAYGVMAEYSIVNRSFDESVMWRKRFIDELSEIFKPKNFKTKERSWL